jgi:hypothetical protein
MNIEKRAADPRKAPRGEYRKQPSLKAFGKLMHAHARARARPVSSLAALRGDGHNFLDSS